MIQVNLWAVLVSGMAAWVLGALWYSPILFGKQWMKMSNLKDLKPNPGVFIIGALAYILMAYVLADVMVMFNDLTVAGGLAGGFWMWLGFIAPITLGSVLYEQKPVKLYLLNNAYNLLAMLLMGAILAVMQR